MPCARPPPIGGGSGSQDGGGGTRSKRHIHLTNYTNCIIHPNYITQNIIFAFIELPFYPLSKKTTRMELPPSPNPHICGGNGRRFLRIWPTDHRHSNRLPLPPSHCLPLPPTFVAVGLAALGRCQPSNFSPIIVKNFMKNLCFFLQNSYYRLSKPRTDITL